ncbi:hypothetical protein SAMD00019534_033990, partial [Acytostelium subglobosum LB1]|uniref:hypothetical protein n=1 Tax=Acytostelium subglobosum LB1 TaxID=1410327 RepID=UPI000644E9B1
MNPTMFENRDLSSQQYFLQLAMCLSERRENKAMMKQQLNTKTKRVTKRASIDSLDIKSAMMHQQHQQIPSVPTQPLIVERNQPSNKEKVLNHGTAAKILYNLADSPAPVHSHLAKQTKIVHKRHSINSYMPNSIETQIQRQINMLHNPHVQQQQVVPQQQSVLQSPPQPHNMLQLQPEYVPASPTSATQAGGNEFDIGVFNKQFKKCIALPPIPKDRPPLAPSSSKSESESALFNQSIKSLPSLMPMNHHINNNTNNTNHVNLPAIQDVASPRPTLDLPPIQSSVV